MCLTTLKEKLLFSLFFSAQLYTTKSLRRLIRKFRASMVYCDRFLSTRDREFRFTYIAIYRFINQLSCSLFLLLLCYLKDGLCIPQHFTVTCAAQNARYTHSDREQ